MKHLHTTHIVPRNRFDGLDAADLAPPTGRQPGFCSRRAPRRLETGNAPLAGPTPFARVLPGDVIPEFSLRSTTNQRVRSSDLAGRRLVLAFTGAVGDRPTRTMVADLGRAYPSLLLTGALVLAIAPVEADTGSLVEPGVPVPFPLLRDVAASVHRSFGAVDWSGQPAPSLFIVDRSRRVTYRALAGLGERLPRASDVLTLLRFDRLICPGRGAPTPWS